MKVSKTVRHLMTDNDITTNTDLISKSGISNYHLTKILKDDGTVPLAVVVKLMTYFGYELTFKEL